MAVKLIANSGEIVLVDDEDYAFAKRGSWKIDRDGVVVRCDDGAPLHHLIVRRVLGGRILGELPDGFDLVHRDGDRLDNRRFNMCFTPRRASNVAGFYGVKFSKRHLKWQAIVRVAGVGRAVFGADPKSAAKARGVLAQEIYDKLASLNLGAP